VEGPVWIPGGGSAGIFDLGGQDGGRGCATVTVHRAQRSAVMIMNRLAVRNVLIPERKLTPFGEGVTD
jgi:hypothetical protein